MGVLALPSFFPIRAYCLFLKFLEEVAVEPKNYLEVFLPILELSGVEEVVVFGMLNLMMRRE